MRKALMIASTLTLALPACVPFAGGPPIVTAQSAGCSSLVPTEWREGVAGADLPLAQSVIGDWIAFADAQTGKLDQANDRTSATIGIVARCEERDRQAVERATRRRFLGLF